MELRINFKGKFLSITNSEPMETNEILQRRVQDAIKGEPSLHAAEIGVIVRDGVITLTGIVDSYAKKLEAEKATKKVTGVKAVVEKIEIVYGHYEKKTDTEIATEILNAFKWNWAVPSDKVRIKVENGWVTLEGNMNLNYQKEAAKNAITGLMGIRGITNTIFVKSEVNDLIEKNDIKLALSKNWSIEDDNVEVEVSGNKVTLSGSVDSHYEKEEAERIAWNVIGVWSVQNELVISEEYS